MRSDCAEIVKRVRWSASSADRREVIGLRTRQDAQPRAAERGAANGLRLRARRGRPERDAIARSERAAMETAKATHHVRRAASEHRVNLDAAVERDVRARTRRRSPKRSTLPPAATGAWSGTSAPSSVAPRSAARERNERLLLNPSSGPRGWLRAWRHRPDCRRARSPADGHGVHRPETDTPSS